MCVKSHEITKKHINPSFNTKILFFLWYFLYHCSIEWCSEWSINSIDIQTKFNDSNWMCVYFVCVYFCFQLLISALYSEYFISITITLSPKCTEITLFKIAIDSHFVFKLKTYCSIYCRMSNEPKLKIIYQKQKKIIIDQRCLVRLTMHDSSMSCALSQTVRQFQLLCLCWLEFWLELFW